VKPSTDVRMRHALTILSFTAALVALLTLTWSVYRHGLSGDFLFDDFANLPAIGATGPIDNWAAFWRYITSGTADPTGRPLTLLTFLIDARKWPASPYPFKVTNVVLHLINGALLAWLLWKLGQALRSTNTFARGVQAASSACDGGKDSRCIAIAALFGAGVWLLHPLFVSTTLYIVQREAMLPATFALVGMLGWIASREALVRGHLKYALIGMALSAWLCTLLAVLSKANGALLPLLLLLTEWIVLSRRSMPDPRAQRWYKCAVAVFLIVPSVLLVAYLLAVIPGYVKTTPTLRGWTVGERLLTEPRVVIDYLRLLFVPHTHSTGLFNDQFAVSTSWLFPASTLPCMVLVLALIGAGFALRKRFPAVALALLFYFGAQLMESGWLPLELYYEHRNYLPAMLLFWPIGLALGSSGPPRFLKVAAGLVVLTVLAVMTSQRATLWGDGFKQAQVWAAFNPDSARAQTNAALYDLRHDRSRLAAARLRLALPRHPDDIQAPINLIGAECRLGAVRPETLIAAENALANTRAGGTTTFNWFGEALDLVTGHACTGLDYNALQATLNAVQRNPIWRDQPGRQQDLAHMQGQLDLAEGDPEAALRAFNRALAATPDPGAALQQAAYLGAQGYPKFGLAHLDYFAGLAPGPKPIFGMPRIHAWVLHKQGWWKTETAYLRKTLETDAASKAASGSQS
jgi:tetratricopeptide (TPR) repeat protein